LREERIVKTSQTTDASPESAVRAEGEKAIERQKRLAELLNCPPEKVEHEVRNVLNELRLLRTLFETQEKK
jgi:hypothetical protein